MCLCLCLCLCATQYDPATAAEIDDGEFWVEYREALAPGRFETLSMSWNPAGPTLGTPFHKVRPWPLGHLSLWRFSLLLLAARALNCIAPALRLLLRASLVRFRTHVPRARTSLGTAICR